MPATLFRVAPSGERLRRKGRHCTCCLASYIVYIVKCVRLTYINKRLLTYLLTYLWCNLQVNLCDPCLSALWVGYLQYSSFPFLSYPFLSSPTYKATTCWHCAPYELTYYYYYYDRWHWRRLWLSVDRICIRVCSDYAHCPTSTFLTIVCRRCKESRAWPACAIWTSPTIVCRRSMKN